jgi:hypothetical protein
MPNGKPQLDGHLSVGAGRVIGDIKRTLNCHHTIQLVTRSAPDDRPDDDGETVPADSCQDLCKLAEQWQRLILILIFNLNHFYNNNKKPPLRLACVSTQRPTQRPSRGYVGCFVSTHPPCCVGFLAAKAPARGASPTGQLGHWHALGSIELGRSFVNSATFKFKLNTNLKWHAALRATPGPTRNQA